MRPDGRASWHNPRTASTQAPRSALTSDASSASVKRFRFQPIPTSSGRTPRGLLRVRRWNHERCRYGSDHPTDLPANRRPVAVPEPVSIAERLPNAEVRVVAACAAAIGRPPGSPDVCRRSRRAGRMCPVPPRDVGARTDCPVAAKRLRRTSRSASPARERFSARRRQFEWTPDRQ
jgi:hypothetical protein